MTNIKLQLFLIHGFILYYYKFNINIFKIKFKFFLNDEIQGKLNIRKFHEWLIDIQRFDFLEKVSSGYIFVRT